MQTPERLPSPVCKTFLGILASSLDYSNSERTQQYGADEREHGEHRQHIEPQGKVHVISPCLLQLGQVYQSGGPVQMTNILQCRRIPAMAARWFDSRRQSPDISKQNYRHNEL